MYDFQKCTMFSPEVDFESSRSRREVRVLKQSQSALFGSTTSHDNIVCIHTYDEYMKSIDSGRLSQALVHFCDGSCELIY